MADKTNFFFVYKTAWLHFKKSLTQTLAPHLGLHTMGPAVTASSIIKDYNEYIKYKNKINPSDV